MKYPGLLPRFIGQLIDYLLFCAVFFPVTYLVKGTWLMTRADHLWVIFDPICGVFLVIIFTILRTEKQHRIGDILAKTVVIFRTQNPTLYEGQTRPEPDS
jgi:uncharacterized RDD family membrane protein YckC